MEIDKVVIPAAGLGTRFMPYTNAVPKEMLPLLNKPAIQYIVEEALASDLNNVFFITSRGKEAITDYFDVNIRMDAQLENQQKESLVAGLKKILRTANFAYVRQSQPLGLGHAILQAKNFIGKEYFGVMLPDDIITTKNPAIGQLMRVARQEKGSVIAVQEVPQGLVSNYGVVGIKKQITPNLFQISSLVEKPEEKDAPSNLAVVGRYVLSNKIFNSLNDLDSGYGDGEELQLTDAIAQMMRSGEKVFAYKVQGTRYDVGTPIGWVKAVIGMAMQDPEYAPYLSSFLNDWSGSGSFIYNKDKMIEHSK
jgi:UTP--glucose-1-phosphate uridylyltransferase